MTNVSATARRLYDALEARNADAILAAMTDDFVGEVSAGMPMDVGGRHQGPDAMLRDVWGRIFAAYDVHVDVERYLPSSDDTVVALGRYRGTARASGGRLDARFAHVLSVRDDRVAGLEQITDTRQWTSDVRAPRPAASGASADALLPVADFRERHDRHIAAPPEAVWAALFELRLSELVLSRTLMEARALPARLTGHARQPPIAGRLIEHGPLPVLITHPNRAIVAGGVLQPWKLRGGAPAPRLDADALRAFDQRGWVKCAMDFILASDGDGTHLSTETRVHATDPRTRVVFGLYWLLIRAGSALIRRDMLRAVARRAEASSEPQRQQ